MPRIPFRYSSAFLDVREVQAPRDVVAALLEDFFRKAGLETQAREGIVNGCPLRSAAVSPRHPLALLKEATPKLVRYNLDARGDNATRVELQIGFGTTFERVIY